MMQMSRYFMLLFVMALLLPSCATTKLTSLWRDEAYQNHPQKILVIGMLKTPANRRIFEDEMVKQLKARGTDALAGYSVLPEQAEANKETITTKMNERGTDVVLIARLMDKKTVTTYIPGDARSGYPGYGGGWHGYYAYSPGYVVQDEYALVQTNLYDLKTDKLIWTAASKTWITDNDEILIQSFIKVIIERLVSDKMLSAGPEK
jgi:hypothetical protein